MTDTATEPVVTEDGLAPWVATDDAPGAPLTLDVPVTIRMTLTPANVPDDLAMYIMAAGPEATAEAARRAAFSLVLDALPEANAGATYLVASLVEE